MFIISWNVAGWSATSRMIREDFGSIGEFFRRTQADIICLQEVKGSWNKLEVDSHGMGASDRNGKSAIDGWESFWSFSSKEHRGFNGVATFVRKGFTWWCDSRPFGDEQLNNEGRVVVTGHSGFVLINTYVVNSRGGLRSELKMRFLTSLKELVIRLRKETGKPVILVGDMNQTYRAEDACWTLRRLDLPAVLELCCRAKEEKSGAEGKNEWSLNFPFLSVATLLRLQAFIAEQVSLSLITTENDSKSIKSNKNKNTAFLGCFSVNCDRFNDFEVASDNNINSNETSFDYNLSFLLLKEKIRERQEEQRRNGSCVFAATLEELCSAGVCSVSVDSLTRSQPVTHNRELFALTQYCGLPPHTGESVHFMKEFLADAHLQDVFLARPSNVDENEKKQYSFGVMCPYTCWDQSRNARQRNEGTRIDYILIDEALVSTLVSCSNTENNIGVSAVDDKNITTSILAEKEKENLSSFEFFDEFDGRAMKIGTHRAMAGGVYPIAPFDGSGLPPVDVNSRDVQFRGLPSTGLFVTPPQYSDHCGVCAFFKNKSSLLVERVGNVEERHRCLYRPPVSLHNFFTVKRTRSELVTVGTKEGERRITIHNTGGDNKNNVDYYNNNDDVVVIVEKKEKC